MTRYNPVEIQKKWQRKWDTDKTFVVNLEKAQRPLYNLMMFPYPSGEGLHVGHVYAFGGADTFGHFKKMQGFDVFEPMGFDSFGIHSENFAIKQNKHPKELTDQTTKYFRDEQLKKLGAIFAWDHEVITSDVDYYRWTQWLFVQLFKAGLAIRKRAKVDWCPSCLTVLANEQVISGKCERCGTDVVQKELEQWFFKITNYAQKLLDNLEKLDWSNATKTMQKNWIGRSEGAEIEFKLRDISGQADLKHSVKVYTTRPDTLFGVTFMAISPETAKSWLDVGWRSSEEVKKYIKESLSKTEVTRQEEGKDKTGVDAGIKAVHPLTGTTLPVWIADYVLGSYGTGAIMAVPAHDQRDFEFAKKYDLPIIEVISGGEVNQKAYSDQGKLINSGEFSGLTVKEGSSKIVESLEKESKAKAKVQFHLRDWLISRQRYWGPPIPMIYCEACAKEERSWFTTPEAEERLNMENLRYLNSNILQLKADMKGWYPVPEEDLPVELPFVKDYQPRGKGISPLGQVPEFLNVKCPNCGHNAKRETDVSDTFLDSSWYFLRYPSIGTESSKAKIGSTEITLPWNRELTEKWLPVDSYIGGNEHAVLHLMYSRFVTMALQDMGFLDFDEPFKKFRAHALIIYKGAKMSKSRGNVVNPNEYIEAYGSDALKMYLLFIGPFELGGEFNDRAISGVYRFLNRVWTLVEEFIAKNSENENQEIEIKLNELIAKVSSDFEHLKFNTAIAALMEFLNDLYKRRANLSRETIKDYLLLLSPLAPFTTEELWELLGEKSSIHNQSWPEIEQVGGGKGKWTIVIQVNGRFRDKIEVEGETSKDEVARLALEKKQVNKYTSNDQIKQVIWVKGKLINFVI